MLAAAQLHALAAALQSHPPDSPLWAGLREFIADTIADANANTTELVSPSGQREWWAGHERGLRDLWADLEALRSGEYRHWPELRQPAPPDTDEAEDKDDKD